ncbi:RNA-guided endonuclease InsQ/TnpB family protein [Bacillus massiliigorillae]|uniref:RNA-guided endonuclease InsQ/TnpB family protein n=1 Tax=Bacillus massiliigorillae TaxID=1243664 RepID=UPI0005A82630|nr:RNA-guided endonuclease TnpB family protein [Bacillus massiliigorillae]
MNITITAKIKILPTIEQVSLLQKTVRAYRNGCNFVSEIVFHTKQLKQAALHRATYTELRSGFALRSQMAQSVMKTVIAKYKTNKNIGYGWSLVRFRKPEYDLLWNRDYSIMKDCFSVNTLQGRIKVPFIQKGMEKYFDGSWVFGTAKLICKHKKWLLLIPMTKYFEQASYKNIRQVVGIDFGQNFLATTYDSRGKTTFFSGRQAKHKRAQYKRLLKQLQMKKTPSARQRLREIRERENRWITDVNHCVSKALVSKYGKNTLFVIEELNCAQKEVCYGWYFEQLRQMLEYKARMKQSKVIAVEPKYTSQTCPKCGHTERANRNKKQHMFICKTCQYTSNDDRIAAMNLQQNGIEYIVAVTALA